MFQSIVVGTDGSEGGNVAVSTAISLAAPGESVLHIVTVGRHPITQGFVSPEVMAPVGAIDAWQDAERDVLDTVLSAASAEAEKHGVKVEVHSEFGSPAEVLCAVAENVDADLIVVGNRGMQGKRRVVLGSVPNSVSHHAPCSVLIVKTT
jgi:nucleotide-binding universal stress UspA family protein